MCGARVALEGPRMLLFWRCGDALVRWPMDDVGLSGENERVLSGLHRWLGWIGEAAQKNVAAKMYLRLETLKFKR